MAVRIVTGCTIQSAVDLVVDGAKDCGIDAYGFVDNPAHAYLVQAKCGRDGNTSLKLQVVKDAIDGLRLINREKFRMFNMRARSHAERVKYYRAERDARVTLVFALMGSEPVHPELKDDIEEYLDEFNDGDAWLDYRVLGLTDFIEQIRIDAALAPLRVTVPMVSWYSTEVPLRSVVGVVFASDLVAWYTQYGKDLFAINLRNPTDAVPFDAAMADAVAAMPEHFQYYNYGVTILCDRVDQLGVVSAASGGSAEFLAINASIVNGAQTVASLSHAMKDQPEAVKRAHVMVKLIETSGAPEGFIAAVRSSVNRSVAVDARDFVSRDPVQSRIRAEFEADLDKIYAIARGDIDPAPDSGCTVFEAATALTLAAPDPRLSYRISRRYEALWDRGEQGVYSRVFGPETTGIKVWWSVTVYRAIRQALDVLAARLEGRAATLVDHGVELIAHITMRRLNLSEGDDFDQVDESEALLSVPSTVSYVIRQLIYLIDKDFRDTSVARVLSNQERYVMLVNDVLADLRAGRSIPAMSSEYVARRRSRMPNSVRVIIDHAALQDGEALVYRSGSLAEQVALADWLGEDPRRARARWVNNLRAPIIWEVDGEPYSASGLAAHMHELAQWVWRPLVIQGPSCWQVERSGESLAELARRLLGETEGLG